MKLFLILSVLVLSLKLSSSYAEESFNFPNDNFKYFSLQTIIRHYQNQGFNVVYSDHLVTPKMVCRTNPKNATKIDRLRAVLKPFGLILEQDSLTNTWYIVANDATQEVEEEPAPYSDNFTHEILVTASVYKNKKSHHRFSNHIDEKLIEYSPTRGGDPIQIINTVPGVAVSGVSVRPYIRGGSTDELLIIFNGIELIDPFHLKDFQSLISGINSSIVESIDIYSGGYPARYGGKMSGVMELNSPPLSKNHENSIDLNLFSTSLKLQGDFGEANPRWMLAARRGNIDDVLQRVNPDIGAPRFSDFYASSSWELNKEVTLDFGYLAIRDDIELTSLDEADDGGEEEGERATSIYNSQYTWAKANYKYSDDNQSKFIFTSIDIKNHRNGYISEPNNPDESIGTVDDKRRFKILRIDASNTLKFKDMHTLETGIRLEYGEGRYDYRAQAQLGELATIIGNGRDINREFHLYPKALSTQLYGSYQFVKEDRFLLETGLRFDSQGYYKTTKYQLSPRLASRIKITRDLDLKVSAGRFFQAPDINGLQIADGESEFYRPQKSNHYILGFEYSPSLTLRYSLEAYSKNVFSPRTRYENLFNPYSLLPEIAPDRVKISPEKATIRGIESLVEYKPRQSINLWLSYTVSEARDLIDGQQRYRAWDQRRAIQGGALISGRSWTLSSVWLWHSGWRTTELPKSLDSLDYSVTYEKNNRELPNYFSFDFKATYQWILKHYNLELYAEITNLTNNRNLGIIEAEISENIYANHYDINLNQEPSFPRIPSIGVTLVF